ncbi:uncharacterized protein BCR38DRAFT_437377 [Pseudomassariella vexata]|uniref:Uncharacterized protein n=1 Tax=Pseudomassariella vexata TaxID=1141098 RepID=A0A1Y2DSG8_9PEZI|nr:uncharacterized protein BCR38DRAFT_437377 [Pseudomassariella vexata]ORY62076.1 hypothetical protein BCR38DRAFT_437377 [Pseudomassariella vexata]
MTADTTSPQSELPKLLDVLSQRPVPASDNVTFRDVAPAEAAHATIRWGLADHARSFLGGRHRGVHELAILRLGSCSVISVQDGTAMSGYSPPTLFVQSTSVGASSRMDGSNFTNGAQLTSALSCCRRYAPRSCILHGVRGPVLIDTLAPGVEGRY